jgi:RNA polymerase sigma factor (TIGR02999 family)
MSQKRPMPPDQLFVALYQELRRLAQREVQRSGATLSPTTLLHETFLSLCQRESLQFTDKAPMIAYAARAMRGLVIDHVRSRQAQKRGCDYDIVLLSDEVEEVAQYDPHLARLNEALENLSVIEERLAQCVDLKFFCGFSLLEIARVQGVSPRTVKRDWAKARVLLAHLMGEHASDLQDA